MLFLDDHGLWAFTVSGGRGIRDSKHDKMMVEILDKRISHATDHFDASEHNSDSTEGCEIPNGK